jgi:hypothetical protein
MLTLLEGILLVCLISMIVYWRLSPSKGTGKKELEERVVALERQNSLPDTFFVLNGNIELNSNWQIFI